MVKGKREELKAVLAKFGVSTLSALKPETYAKVKNLLLEINWEE